MKIKHLIEKIEKEYPKNSSYDFDNTGANIVDFDSDIKGILICLDVTLSAIEKAKENGANLIISHHPLTFLLYKNINDDIQAKRIKTLIKNNINAYSMHTNFDVNLISGMGKIVINKIFDKNEITKQDLLEIFLVDKKKYGIGNIITLKKNINFNVLSEKVLSKLNISYDKASLYKICDEQSIKRIAILPGSGASEIEKVINNNIDCLITSDLRHNQILDLLESGVSYIGATHYGLEKIFVEYMNTYIKKKINCNIYTYIDELM